MRRGMLDVIASEGMKTGRGHKRIWYKGIAAACNGMPEAQIKYYLYSFLNCSDITAAERQEVLRLLQFAETALTDDQRRQIYNSLYME